MGDREIKQFNRILFAKFGNRTQELHLQRLKNDIKPVIDNSSPPQFAHLSDRRKVKQRWSDEQTRIEYENMILLQKMRNIMTETQNKQFLDASHPNSAQGGSQSIISSSSIEHRQGSLNRGERIKEMKRILHENESLLTRIQARGPTYHVADWEAAHIQKEKQLAGMGRFPYHSTTLPPQIMADLQRAKPIKRYGTMRYPVQKPSNDHSGEKRRSSYGYSNEDASIDESPSEGSSSQPITPVKASPRRVHHLPPKSFTEEKQEYQRKKSASKRSKDVAPIQITFNIEHVTEQLTDANDSIRVLVYLRADSGEYVPTSEVHLTSITNNDNSISFTGLTEVPGLSNEDGEAAAADRRVRVALFHSSDPAFAAATSSSGVAVPRDNTHLLGEARFSLQHFINFPRPLYKLKVLKHGLPISGPNFATAQNAPNGAVNHQLSEEEISRRRQLPETILVLQYSNKPLPAAAEADRAAEEQDYSVDPLEAETESTTITEAKQENKSNMSRQFDEAAANATSPKSSPPAGVEPTASHLRVAVSGISTSFQPKTPAVYLFLLTGEGDDASEKTIGSSERFTGKTNGGGSGSSVVAPIFHKSVAVKDLAGLAAKGAMLRLAVYDTAVPASAGHTQSKAPEAKRTALLSDVKISASDLLDQAAAQQSSNDSSSLWRLEGTKHSAHDSSSKRASSATSTTHPVFLVHIANVAAGADSADWIKAVEAQRADIAAESKKASDARAAALAAEQKASKHTADLDRTKKVRAVLLSDQGQAVVSYYSPPSEEEAIADADKLLTAAGKGGEAFVISFVHSSSDAYRNYNTVQELSVDVKAGYDALVAARHSIVAQLSLDGCKLLPHLGSSSPFKTSSSNAEVDALAAESGLPLLALGDVCSNNAHTLVQRLQALDAKGVSYSGVKQLAAAIKEEGEAQAAAAAAAASQEEYYQEADPALAAPAEAEAEAAPVVADAEPAADVPAEKSAADILAEIQSAKAAQEAEVARVMAEKGLSAPKNEYEEEEEWSKPYVEDPPATEQQPAAVPAADEYNDEFPPEHPASEPVAAAAPPKATKQPSRFADNPELAATKIQALARGRSVRNKKDAIRAEKKAAKDAARLAKEAAAKKLAEEEKRDDDAALAKRTAEADAKRKAAEEQEARIAKQKEDDAALLAKTKAAEAEAALAKEKAEKEAAARQEEDAQARAVEEQRKREELAAKVREAEEAKRKSEEEAAAKATAEAAEKAKVEAAAKQADADWKAKVEQWQKDNAQTNFAMNLTVGCKGLNASSAKDCHPMIALYGKAADGSFSFVSQTERIQATCDPIFAEPLQIDPVNGKGARGTDEDRQYMFSIYNVANEDDIKETDVMGTALITQSQLYDLIGRDRVAAPFISVSLPISQNGSEIPGAFVTVTKIQVGSSSAPAAEPSTPVSTAKSSATAAAAAASSTVEGVVIGPGDVGIFVSIKNIILPKGVTECNSLAALYTKDHESSNFNYVSQTDQVTGSVSPKFIAPLVITRPAAGHDTDCMLNVYNHLSDDAEVTDDAALGACLFSLNRLLTSSRGAIAVALVKDGEIRGQVILRTKADASSTDVSRPASAVVSKSSNSTKSDAPIADTYDLRISCSNLPQRADQKTTNAMVALYGQDPATNNFAYIAQTEKFDNSRSPTFESLVRLDAQSGGGGAADRPLMLMIYSVVDENNISEEDQIGTCALKWSFLKEQANTAKKSLTLPLLDKNGAQEKEASITIQIIPVKSL